MASTLDTTGVPSAVSVNSTGFGGGVSIDYDAATGGYTVHDSTGASQTFLPSDKDTADTNAIVTSYAKTAGNRTDTLALFNPGAGNTKLALTYVSYGAWQTKIDNTTSLDATQQFFVFGIREAANAPSTGSASYTMTAPDGFWTNPSGIYTLSGTSTLTADWNAMTVSTTLDLTGTNVADGLTTKRLGLFNGSGSIAALGGGFSGTLTHQGTDADGHVYSGNFAGAFFGPAGQEIGYTFSLVGAGGGAVGAVVGKGN